jgi:hypothetical protein
MFRRSKAGLSMVVALPAFVADAAVRLATDDLFRDQQCMIQLV